MDHFLNIFRWVQIQFRVRGWFKYNEQWIDMRHIICRSNRFCPICREVRFAIGCLGSFRIVQRQLSNEVSINYCLGCISSFFYRRVKVCFRRKLSVKHQRILISSCNTACCSISYFFSIWEFHSVVIESTAHTQDWSLTLMKLKCFTLILSFLKSSNKQIVLETNNSHYKEDKYGAWYNITDIICILHKI